MFLGVFWVYAKKLVPGGGLTVVVEGGRVSTAPSSWGIVVEGVAGVEGEGGEEVEENAEGVEGVACDEDVGKVGGGAGEGGFIFSMYFSFLFKFLLWVEGLGFFLVLVAAGASFSWVAREKEKEVPRVREKLKVLLWLASAWQNSRHLLAKPLLFTSAADIFVVF